VLPDGVPVGRLVWHAVRPMITAATQAANANFFIWVPLVGDVGATLIRLPFSNKRSYRWRGRSSGLRRPSSAIAVCSDDGEDDGPHDQGTRSRGASSPTQGRATRSGARPLRIERL